MSRHLVFLPLEVIVKILGYVDFKELLRLQRVCQALRDIIANTTSLLLPITARACGIRLNFTKTPSPDLYRALLSWERAWRDLEWTSAMSLDLDANQSLFIPSGIMVIIDFTADWHTNLRTTKLSLTRLPSKIRSVKESRWTVCISSEVHRRVALVDTSQDLVLEEHTALPSPGLTGTPIHVQTFSLLSGLPHPTAANGYFTLNPRMAVNYYMAHGNYICLARRGGMSDSILWNWKTNEQIQSQRPTKDSIFGHECFLDDNFQFFLRTVRENTDHIVYMCIYQLHATSKPYSGEPLEQALVAFELPHLLEKSKVNYVRACSPVQSPSADDEDFSLARDPALILASFAFNKDSYNNGSYIELIVSSDALLSYIPPPDYVPTGKFAVREVAWKDWGPAHTHLSKAPSTEDIRRYGQPGISRFNGMCGMRRILQSPVKLTDGTLVFELRDYHPGRVSRAVQVAGTSEKEGRRWEVRHDDSLSPMWMEDDTIEANTALPYLVTRRALPDEFQGAQADPRSWRITLAEDSIMAWRVDPTTGSTQEPQKIHIWNF